MSSNKIEDSQIKASSVRHPLFKPSHGRLKLNTGGGAWCASPDLHDTKQYLLVTLKNPFIMTGVATQGMSDGKSWVKSYYLSYTVNQRNWFYYHDVSSKKVRSEYSLIMKWLIVLDQIPPHKSKQTPFVVCCAQGIVPRLGEDEF